MHGSGLAKTLEHSDDFQMLVWMHLYASLLVTARAGGIMFWLVCLVCVGRAICPSSHFSERNISRTLSSNFTNVNFDLRKYWFEFEGHRSTFFIWTTLVLVRQTLIVDHRRKWNFIIDNWTLLLIGWLGVRMESWYCSSAPRFLLQTLAPNDNARARWYHLYSVFLVQ